MGFCKYKVQTQLVLLKKDCIILFECIYIHVTETGKAFELTEVTGTHCTNCRSLPDMAKGLNLNVNSTHHPV